MSLEPDAPPYAKVFYPVHAELWGCGVKLYIVQENDLERLSELDKETHELQGQAVAYISIGMALILEPAFMGVAIVKLPPLAMLVAWVFGSAILIHGWRTLVRYRKLKVSSTTHFEKIKKNAKRVPARFTLTADQLDQPFQDHVDPTEKTGQETVI